MADEKPPEKPTVEFEKPPAWAISMMERQQEGFTAIDGRLDTIDGRLNTMETNLDLQGDTTRDVAKRITGVEDRLQKVEERQNNASIRVRQPSEMDMANAAQLAQERAAREDLAKQVDSLTVVNRQQLELLTDVHASAKKLLDRPEVKWLAAALWMAFTAWLATKGIK